MWVWFDAGMPPDIEEQLDENAAPGSSDMTEDVYMQDAIGEDDIFDDTTPIGSRDAWWERMVEHFNNREGVLCLA